MTLLTRSSKSSTAASDGVLTLKLGFIIEQLGGQLYGSPEMRISRLFSLTEAVEGDISFLSNHKYSSQLDVSQASCVVVGESHREAAIRRGACIVA